MRLRALDSLMASLSKWTCTSQLPRSIWIHFQTNCKIQVDAGMNRSSTNNLLMVMVIVIIEWFHTLGIYRAVLLSLPCLNLIRIEWDQDSRNASLQCYLYLVTSLMDISPCNRQRSFLWKSDMWYDLIWYDIKMINWVPECTLWQVIRRRDQVERYDKSWPDMWHELASSRYRWDISIENRDDMGDETMLEMEWWKMDFRNSIWRGKDRKYIVEARYIVKKLCFSVAQFHTMSSKSGNGVELHIITFWPVPDQLRQEVWFISPTISQSNTPPQRISCLSTNLLFQYLFLSQILKFSHR
jgi:hypothetical protein